MKSKAIATMTKMMETLPETTQNQVVEHLRDYITDFLDELQWDALFQKTQKKLIAVAKHAREEITKGHSKPMDYNRL